MAKKTTRKRTTSKSSKKKATPRSATAGRTSPAKGRRRTTRSVKSTRRRQPRQAEPQPIVGNEPAAVHLPDRAIHAPGKRHRTPPPEVTAFTKAAPHVAKLRIAADARNRRG